MANWYARPDGSNGNVGSGPSTTQAVKDPDVAINKAAAGDTVYLAPGTYRKQGAPTVSGGSGNVIAVIGDVDGSHFASADVPIAPGTVTWTSYDGPNDWTAPVGTSPTLAFGGTSNFTFQNINFIAGKNIGVYAGVAGSTGLTFQRCSFTGGFTGTNNIVLFTGTSNVAANVLFDQCTFYQFGTAAPIALTVPTTSGAEYSSGITIQNCRFVSPASTQCIAITNSAGTGTTNYGGGIVVQECSFVCGGNAVRTSGSALVPSGVGKNTVRGCLILGGGLAAGASGQVVEDFNLIFGAASYSNVSVGPNTVNDGSYAPLWHHGQELVIGRPSLPFLTPFANGPLAGFGNIPSALSVDLVNRPRPAGGGSLNTGSDSGTATAGTSTTLTDSGKTWTVNQWQATPAYFVTITGGTGSGERRAIISNTATALTVNPAWATTPDATSTYAISNFGAFPAVGALERHDTLVKESVIVDAGLAASAVGPHDHEFLVPVTPSGTVISIKTQWDANYGAGTKPQLVLVANPEIGVAAQAVAAAGSAGAWNTITLASFTPTAAGIVKLRLVSSAAAAGKVAWDTATVPGVNTGTFDTFFRNQPAPFLDSTTGSTGSLKRLGLGGGF